MEPNNEPTVEFEEEEDFGQLKRPHEVHGMAGFVIKHSGGLVKNEKQANLVLMVVIVIVVTLTFMVIS